MLVYSKRHITNIYLMSNIKTKSISISHEILWLNINYVKLKSRLEKSHDPYTKEQYIKNDYGIINIKTNVIPQVHHPVYNTYDIVNEEQHPV